MSPTPILDRCQPAPAAKRGILPYLIGGAIGVAASLLSVAAPDAAQQVLRSAPALNILLFVVALILGVVIHELGHWVAGAAAGFEFRHILAGALMLKKEATGYRFRLLPKRLLSGGQTFMVARTTKDLRRRFFIFGAGGPMATALLFLPVIFLAWSPATLNLLLAKRGLGVFQLASIRCRGPSD
jgi:hypothetical protein